MSSVVYNRLYIYLLLTESVVEGKCMIFNVFGNAINLVLGFVDFDLGIGTRYGINLSILFFFFEDGALADTNRQLAYRIDYKP